MTEERAEYVTGAMEMMGKGYEPSIEIQPPEEVTVRRGKRLVSEERAAFVKISTAFKDSGELKEVDEIALKVWLFIALSVNRNTGEAHPGLRTIADGTGFAVNTVRAAVERLDAKYHLLTVERGEHRYNRYFPSDYVSANAVSPADTPRETVSDGPQTVSVGDETVSPRVILNQINQRNQKKGDLVDGVLHYAALAKERGEDKVEAVIQELEMGLHVNIQRSLQNQQTAKRILKDGRPISAFLSWVNAEDWRCAHAYFYADLGKVWRDWPQAFAAQDSKYNPQGLQVGL